MYLATAPNIQSYLKNLLDLADVEDNTLLVFESRHVIECCQIIYGMLNILNGVGMYKIEYKTGYGYVSVKYVELN